MTPAFRAGDLIRLLEPTLSGWQSIGVVLHDAFDDDDPDTMVSFYKQGDVEQTPCFACLNEVELVAPNS